MSLSTNVSNLATRVATEVKALRTLINGNAADLTALTTTAKNTLVAAINEIDAALSTAGVQIDDVSASTSTVYSSTKTDAQIATAVANLIDSAPGALDTLNELAAALGDDPSFATSIATSLTNLQDAIDAKADSADVGDTTTNFVTTFEAGLV